ncbi:hypothetical protein LguiB_031044 [Lonicera macranthoides]
MEKKGEVVCVTGGSGFIGSWLVRLLLGRGYTVHAIVKDLSQFTVPLFDEKETKHLQALDGAELHLHLFQIDLLHYDSIVAAVTLTTGVFHLASPCIVDQVHDPEKQLLAPAIKGTNNVLTAAKGLGVQRVVVTSSIGAITPSHNWPADVVRIAGLMLRIASRMGYQSFPFSFYFAYLPSSLLSTNTLISVEVC